MRILIKPSKLITSSVIIIFLFSVILYAYSTGITGRTQKGNTPGCTCHDPNPSANVVVRINGPEILSPGQTGNYSVTISGGPLVRAGTDIAASAGTLTPVSDELQLLNSELTHKLPKAPDSGVVTYNFTYTAPMSTGEETLYANGNSVNFNGNNTGDQWNFAPNKTIQVTGLAGVEDGQIANSFKLEQNYPNPFNPETNIKFSIPKSEFVSLRVYDLLGHEIATLVNEQKAPGNYNVRFSSTEAGNISSGVYLYVLKAGNFSAAKKFILLK